VELGNKSADYSREHLNRNINYVFTNANHPQIQRGTAATLWSWSQYHCAVACGSLNFQNTCQSRATRYRAVVLTLSPRRTDRYEPQNHDKKAGSWWFVTQISF